MKHPPNEAILEYAAKLRELERRTNAIHVMAHEISTEGGRPLDTRRAELRALAHVFLGEDYDVAKLSRIEDFRVLVDDCEATLFDIREREEISEWLYTEKFRQLEEIYQNLCQLTLGTHDFHQMFGEDAAAALQFLDPEYVLGPDHLHGEPSQEVPSGAGRILAEQIDKIAMIVGRTLQASKGKAAGRALRAASANDIANELQNAIGLGASSNEIDGYSM